MTQKSIKRTLDRDVEKNIKSVLEGARNVMSKPAREYMALLTDPRGAKLARSVASGPSVGATGLLRCRSRSTFAIGSNRFGSVTCNPVLTGPYTDRTLSANTGPTFAGVGSTAIPTSAATGVTLANWAEAPYVSASTTMDMMSFRCIAAAIYWQPVSSATAQSGMVYMLESPMHSTAVVETFDSVSSHRATRPVRGVQTGDPANQNVCNWHPRANDTSGINDTSLLSWNAALTTACGSTLVVSVEGDPGTVFEYEIVAVYEMVGRKVGGRKPSIQDSRGWDLICNMISSKSESGWIGKPHHASAGYMAAAWHWAKKFGMMAARSVRPEHISTAREMAKIAGLVL